MSLQILVILQPLFQLLETKDAAKKKKSKRQESDICQREQLSSWPISMMGQLDK